MPAPSAAARARLAGALAGLLLLGACAAPPPVRVAETPAAGAGHWLARGLQQPGLQRWLGAQGAQHAPGAAWSARQLRLAALYFHPSLRLARDGVELARADLRLARQWPDPRLQLGFKYQATQAAALPSPWTIGAAIGLLLWSHEQRRAQEQRAEAGLRAARLMLRASAWHLRRQVDGAFVDCWAARRELALQRQLLAVELRREQVLQQREQQGWVSAWRVDEQLRVLRLQRRAVLDAQAGLESARLRLAAAVGVPGRALHREVLDLHSLDAPAPGRFSLPPRRLAQQALQQRADVQAAWQRVLAARAEVQRQISLRDGAPASVAPGAERDQGANDLTLTANLPLPLLNHHEGQIDAARARQALAQDRLLEVQARAASRIEQARAELRAADLAQRVARQGWRRARRAWVSADAATTREWIDPLQRVLVRQRWLQAQQDLLRARSRQWQALVRLRAVLQGRGAPAIGADTGRARALPTLDAQT